MQNAETANSELFKDVVQLIVEAVNLRGVDASTLTPETSLREGGLELDSIDILEIVVTIEHRYGVKIANAEDGKKHFRNLGSIAEFVRQHRVQP
ncbi:MAG: hypothetical protein KF681_05310 [Bdellovibrionaceae bacterium]|nr:hypothetical protein [Pseudobdellovibrionaceae bacterium]